MRTVILVLSVILLLSSASFSQPVITIDSVRGGLCGITTGYFPSTLYIGIQNPDENAHFIWFTLRIVGAEVGDSITLYNDFLELMTPEQASINLFYTTKTTHLDTTLYTVRIGHPSNDSAFWGDRGLPVRSDTVTYLSLEVTPISFVPFVGGEFCVDSAANPLDSPFDGDTCWISAPGPGLKFGGRTCFWIESSPVSAPVYVVDNPPPDTVHNTNPCHPFTWDFDLLPFSQEHTPPVTMYVKYGPGEIDPITGVYTFCPNGHQLGETFYVDIGTHVDYCEDGSTIWNELVCSFKIVVDDWCRHDDSTVEFYPPLGSHYTAITGDTLKIPLNIRDGGSCSVDTYNYYWSRIHPSPVPSHAWIDDNHNFCYIGQSADTGVYRIKLTVSDGTGQSANYYSQEIVINHWEDFICGDCDHDGQVSLGDLTYLISTLFIDFVPPAPPQAGDVDCDPGLSLGDLTKLIDHMFISLEPMCDCR